MKKTSREPPRRRLASPRLAPLVSALSVVCVVSGASTASATTASVATAQAKTTVKERMAEAVAAGKAKRYAKAAALWEQIYQLAPSAHVCLYNAALMMHEARRFEAEVALLERFLAKVKASRPRHPRYLTAKARLDAARLAVANAALTERLRRRSDSATPAGGEPAQAKATTPASPAAKTAPPGTPGVTSRWLGWAGVGVGSVLALTAGALFVKVSADEADARELYANGQVTLAQANAKLGDYDRDKVIYGAVGGAGLIAVGVGVYLLIRSPARRMTWRVAPWATGSGMSAAVAF